MEAHRCSVEMLRDIKELRPSRSNKRDRQAAAKAHWVLFVKLYSHCCCCLVSFIDVLKVHFYCMCLTVCLHVCVRTMCMPSVQRSWGVSINSHGAGVRDSCSFHVAAGNWSLIPLKAQEGLLTMELSLHSSWFCLLFCRQAFSGWLWMDWSSFWSSDWPWT